MTWHTLTLTNWSCGVRWPTQLDSTWRDLTRFDSTRRSDKPTSRQTLPLRFEQFQLWIQHFEIFARSAKFIIREQWNETNTFPVRMVGGWRGSMLVLGWLVWKQRHEWVNKLESYCCCFSLSYLIFITWALLGFLAPVREQNYSTEYFSLNN